MKAYPMAESLPFKKLPDFVRLRPPPLLRSDMVACSEEPVSLRMDPMERWPVLFQRLRPLPADRSKALERLRGPQVTTSFERMVLFARQIHQNVPELRTRPNL